MTAFTNPILRGCYPDPSVCRVGDDFYLVTSTFEYLPGLPIFHSRDLVSWTQIGHAIDRPGQLDLSSVPSSGGLFAPTIRHDDGTFYITNTLVHGEGKTGNFVITATDPAGPWSDPHWLDDADGIDPSLFFDDGRAWYIGTRLATPGLWHDQTEVWLRELDLATMQLTGPQHILWHGALDGAIWAEGPHLYRIDDRYYLLAAEGGTAEHHAISVAASDTLTGPYIGNPGNPVLTHRNLGLDYPVTAVGHADLVETPDGQWFAVLLASRQYGGRFANLGRETFLVPVSWEAGWPVFAPGVGRADADFTLPSIATTGQPDSRILALRDDFVEAKLGRQWTAIRAQPGEVGSTTQRPDWLRLPVLPASLTTIGSPSFIGRRQQHRNVLASTLIDFAPTSAAELAGIAVRQSENDHLVLAISGNGAGQRRVLVLRRVGGVDTVLAEQQLAEGLVTLSIRIVGQQHSFEYSHSAGETATILATTNGSALSSAVAGGFLGVWIGLFATSNGEASTSAADFDWFDYTGDDPD